LGRETPLHFSAYYPCYKMRIPPTPLESLTRAAEIARRRLDYVYLGNVRTPEGSNTLCPACGGLLVSRSGYTTAATGIRGGACMQCGRLADFVLGEPAGPAGGEG
jgi:pyruvate formate lyase activating enzyme